MWPQAGPSSAQLTPGVTKRGGATARAGRMAGKIEGSALARGHPKHPLLVGPSGGWQGRWSLWANWLMLCLGC